MEEKLIQLIGYRTSLDPDSGKTFFWQKHYKEIEVTSIKKMYDNIDSIIEAIPANERFDVHFTTANCYPPTDDKTVPLRLFAYQEMIPFDLDGIDLNRKDEYIKILTKILKIDISKTIVSCSGNGLHFVILLDYKIDSEQYLKSLQRYYKEVCSLLNITFFDSGLMGKADPVRLSESATLRLPKTTNNKDPHNIKETYIIQSNIEPQSFYLEKLVDIQEVEEIELTTRSVDTKAVLSGCLFLKHCQANPQDISEPQWYAMNSVLAFIPDVGITLCHTYSEPHSDYSYENTQAKIDQALGFGKPRLCESISQVYPGCFQCPYRNKVKTPLSIKGENYITTQDTGFHNIIHLKSGETKYIPNYEDLAKFFGQEAPFITNADTRMVMKFNGKYWVMVDDLELTAFATKHFQPAAKISNRNEFRELMKNKKISVKGFIGKDNNNYLNFNNGVLDLKTRTLLPHSIDYGFTYVLPYDYNKEAKCPNFDAMMDNITLKDKDLYNNIMEFVGYAISGRPNSWIQKVMVLSGEGSNGKSTFMNIIRKLVGEECYSAISIASMAKESNRFSMFGKLFNISFDEDPKALIKGGVNIFKAITAGDPVDMRKYYCDPISAPINAKLIVACNKPLETTDHTHAVYRRMLIIPFRAKFEGATDVKEIHETIYPEMSGIYNKVLDGLDRLIANKGVFSHSDVVANALKEYKYESAVFQRFFEDTFDITKKREDFVANDTLAKEFNNWKDLNNERIDISTLKLVKELKSLGLIHGESEVKRMPDGNKRGYMGFRKADNRF